MCFVSVLCVLFEFVDHDSRWGNTAHALTRWQHTMAPSEAPDELYQAMRPASYRHSIRMAIEIASDSPAFVVVADSLLPTNIAK